MVIIPFKICFSVLDKKIYKSTYFLFKNKHICSLVRIKKNRYQHENKFILKSNKNV